MKIKTIDFLYFSLIISSVFVYFNFYNLNVDSTWILYCAKRMLLGEILYIDITDVNPPLIFMLSVIPAFFTKLFSFSISFSFIIFTLILATISLIFIYYLISSINIFQKNKRAIIYFFTFSLVILPGYTFGEREHLFIIFIFPYLIHMIYINEIEVSKKTKFLISIFASIGFNLKPHFLLLFFFIEFIYLLDKRSIKSIFRIEFLTIFASIFIYLLIIFIYFTEYINITIPLSIDTYTMVKNNIFILLYNYESLFFILVLFIFFIHKPIKDNFKIKVIFTIIFSLLVIYLIQAKGWSYHRLPFLEACMILLGHSIFYKREISLLYLFLLLPIIICIMFFNFYDNNLFKNIKEIIKEIPNNATVQVVTTDIASGQPILKDTQVWASRYSGLFMMPALVRKKEFKTREYIINTFITDLNKFNPDYIIFPQYYDYYSLMISFDDKIRNYYENNYTIYEKLTYKILKRKPN